MSCSTLVCLLGLWVSDVVIFQQHPLLWIICYDFDSRSGANTFPYCGFSRVVQCLLVQCVRCVLSSMCLFRCGLVHFVAYSTAIVLQHCICRLVRDMIVFLCVL